MLSREGSRFVSEQDSFTWEEWRTLQFAPFWMFSAVVGSYRRFDPREYQAFIRCLEVVTTTHGGLSRELAASVVADPDRVLQAYGSDRRTIGVGLIQVDAVLQKTGNNEAAMFKDMLVSAIGEGVARARGRWGSEISDEDARRVALAAELLSFGSAED
jgi:hypothetical protein